MILIRKTDTGPEVLILLPMGTKAAEIVERLREKGLEFQYRRVPCG